jgi:hypothetical protein
VFAGAKAKAIFRSALRCVTFGRSLGPRRLRLRLRHVLIAAVGICLSFALTASARVGTTTRVSAVGGRPATVPFPLSVRQISLRELRGRIVGTATIVNSGNAAVRSTTGLLGVSRGSGGGRATGVLTFSVPPLPSRGSRKLHFTTRPVRALLVGRATYEILICTDIYSQIQRFAQNGNCSPGGTLAISTVRLPRAAGPAPNTVISTRLAHVSGASNAVFRFVSTVGGSTFDCSLDGGPWLGCSSPQRYTALVDGLHTFEVRAISAWGKKDPTPAHASWSVGGLPTVTLTSPVSGSRTKNDDLEFSGAAGTAPGDSSTITVHVFSGQSITGVLVQSRIATVSRGTWSAAPSQPLADGTYTAQAQQSDGAGNTGVSAPSTFTIDSTLPANGTGLTVGGNAGTSGAPALHSVGGTVSGLSGTVVLQNNGGDDLSVGSNGAFRFSSPIADGGAYDVTVKSSPSGQTCSTSGAAGTVASANVTSVVVTCTGLSTTPTPGQDDFDRADGGLGAGWVAMRDGGLSIVSQQVLGTANAQAGDIRTAESYGSDQYSQVEVTSTPLPVGDWIGSAVRSQNGGQDTYLGLYWNDQGTGRYELQLYLRKAGSWVQLGSTYTLGGPLPAGTKLTLSAVGSRISFQQNGVERVAATDTTLTGGAPGLMTFGAATADNWAGGTPSAYSIGGTVSGLSGTMVLQDNGGDDLSVSANGAFTFATKLALGASYHVTFRSTPNAQNCTASGGAGIVASANVTTVAILCTTPDTTPSLQIQSTGTDANGVASYNFTSSDDGYGTHVLRVLAPSNPAPGVPHNFLYVLPVEPELGTTYGDGLQTLRSLDAQDKYNLTIVEPSFAVDPWYADNPNDPNLHYESFMTNDLVPWVTQNFAVPAASQPLGALAGGGQNWLIGFSKSGIGGQDLALKHPDIFSLAASWDFPADMSAYNQFGSSSANNYGTDANFQANYRLTQTFVDAHKTPFLAKNRIWIGGYNAFQTDMSDFDALLTSEGIAHTTESPQQIAHGWETGWMAIALGALSQDSAALAATP